MVVWKSYILFSFHSPKANIITLCHGCAIGWLSPSLTILKSGNSPMQSGSITIEELSWIGAFFSIGSIIGNVSFGVLTHYVGQKKLICCLAIPNIGFWLCVLLAEDPYVLYIGRLLAGWTGGGIYVLVPLFISEIADKSIRGILGSYLMMICCTGILFAFVAGSYLSYHTVPYLFIFLPVLFFVGFLFIPDTPLHFLRTNNLEEAKRSYIFYHNGNNFESIDNKEVDFELDELQKMVETRREKKKDTSLLKSLVSKKSIIGILMGLGLTGLSIFSGTFAMINYTGVIFSESGSNIDPAKSSIIVAAIQVVGVYIATVLVDKLGRRTLLITSSSGAALALSILGTFSYLSKHDVDLTAFNWIPLAAFSFYVLICSIGVLPLPFIILAEILPSNIREVGSTIGMLSISVFAFITLKVFPIIIDKYELYTAMGICCSVCVLGSLFGIFILKETRGKNLNAVDES